VLGVSRKSMIGDLGQQPDPTRRLPGSLAAGLFGLAQGATILRTHDVAETAQAVRVWQALQDGDLVNSATHGSNSAPIPATTDH
jgi:dihydropteroate synthase